MMRRLSQRSLALAAALTLLLLVPSVASVQEVGLVAVDAKEVAKGYRGNALKSKTVVNDKGEIIGRIDDFIFGRNDCQVFVVLAVGDFIGLDGHLVAVKFSNLKIDEFSDSIVLPGADREALLKLPVFLYSR
jgi:hypothetical protein